MREIKFRGKVKKHRAEKEPKTSLLSILLPKPKEDRDEGVWVYGSYVDSKNGNHWIIDHKDSDCILVDPETVGQYTGLKDKNGKEIYEGDILKDDDICGPGGRDVVKFEYSGFRCFDGSTDDFMFYRIIGNIHDNKDLLEEK